MHPAPERADEAVHAHLAFTRAEDVLPPEGRPPLRRARPMAADALHGEEAFAMERCRIQDCTAQGALVPDIVANGFGHVDLTTVPTLSGLLDAVREAGQVSDGQARAIRRALTGASLPLAHGRRLRLLFIAPEGFIMRRGGPNGLRVTASATAQGMNNHDAAVSVHADQDINGTPIRQILRGAGPWVFHHRSPASDNRWSPIFLLNIWVPLQQVTRPLTLMDIQTIDRSAHQLRYGLLTDSFLDRPEDQRINDIWTFLHHPDQDWYFTPDARPGQSYIFQTLSTPHGAFILPGEARAEQLYRRLKAAQDAVRQGAPSALRALAQAPMPATPAPQTRPLSAAIDAMAACLQAADAQAEAICAGRDEVWAQAAAAATDRVVRKSIEMRAVGIITRDIRPRRSRVTGPA